MNASELIQLLREHPKACATIGAMLSLYPSGHCVYLPSTDQRYVEGDEDNAGECVVNRIHFAVSHLATKACDARGIEIHQDRDCPGKFVRVTSQFGYTLHDSRLAACLAGLEAQT